jgi:nicotinamide-nucleotide amidase
MIPNPHGTAPGIDLDVPRACIAENQHCRIFALPGVPAEMFEMFDATVLPRLTDEMGAGETRWRYHSLKVFGIGESDVEHRLPKLIARDRVPRVGITVSRATITLRIAAPTMTDEQFQQLIAPTVNEIREALGDRIFGEGETDIHEAVQELLDQRRTRLGVIEVGAGCRVAHMLASLQSPCGSGLVASQRFASISELNLGKEGDASDSDPSIVEKSLTRAAEAMLQSHALDRCLAVGIYPTSQDVALAPSLPYADFTMCLARRDSETKSSNVSLGGHPDVLYHRLAKTALNFLRLDLLNLTG